MAEVGDSGKRGYGSRAVTEVAIYAVSSLIVLYVLGTGWVLVEATTGRLPKTQAVLGIIGVGLAAPICPWAMRIAIRLQESQSSRREEGAFTGAAGYLLKQFRVWTNGASGSRVLGRLGRRMSAGRATDVGIAVVSVALFFAFYGGSLIAAAIVPITLHWVLATRRRGARG